MMENDAKRAKYCPRCGVMSFVETETCRYCGYRFRSVALSPPPDAELNRTRMFLLPPVPQRSAATPPPRITQRRARLIYLLGKLRAITPLLIIIVVSALICWAIAAGWLSR